nr:isoform 2 of ankyrin repeat domain-containing protein 50 [Quercus suber]
MIYMVAYAERRMAMPSGKLARYPKRSAVINNSTKPSRKRRNKRSKKLDQELLQAALEGSELTVRALLRKRAKVNCQDLDGCSPLHNAVLSNGPGSLKVVQCLLEHGHPPNDCSSRLGTALCLAALRRDQAVVQLLAEQGALAHRTGADVGSAIHAACYSGDLTIVKTVARKPEDVGIRATVNLQLYEAIIDGKVSPATATDDHLKGCTPLMLAARQGHYAVIDHLLKIGRQRTDSMEELSLSPMEQELSASCKVNHLGWRLVTPSWPSLDVEDDCSMTALMHAAKHGHSRCVEQLAPIGHLDQHAEHARVHRTAPALLLAIQGLGSQDKDKSGYEKSAQHLIELGACMVCKGCEDDEGNNVLMLAAQAGCYKIVELILDTIIPDRRLKRVQGGRFRKRNKMSQISKRPIMTDLPLLHAKNYAGLTALMLAAKAGYPACTKCLIDAGSEIDAQAENGWSAIMFAASGKHKEVLDILIDHGASLASRSEGGETVLHKGIQAQRLDIVEAILNQAKITEPGLIDVANHSKQTALHVAVEQNDAACADLLCNARADMSRKDLNKNNALVVAMAIGSLGMVKLLAAHIPQQTKEDEYSRMASKALEYPSASRIRDYITSLDFWRSTSKENNVAGESKTTDPG